jgi:hypothetical protein
VTIAVLGIRQARVRTRGCRAQVINAIRIAIKVGIRARSERWGRPRPMTSIERKGRDDGRSDRESFRANWFLSRTWVMVW